MVFYLSLNDYKNTAHKFDKKHYKEAFEHYKKTLVHEFVHFVNLECFNRIRKCGRPAKYLSEGIATYLSGQKDNKKIIFDYSIDDIMHFDYNKSCYDGWYLVTKYLVENYDKQFVLSLFESNREANDFLQNELYEKAKEFYLNDKSTIVKRKNK